MYNFLRNLLSNSDGLAFFGVLISVITSITIFINSSRKSFERERYDKLIFPLFNLLEPYLFKDKDDIVFQKAIDIIQKNKDIAGGHFLNQLYWCEKSFTQENFISLCTTTNREYDRICRVIGLKCRSIFYRLDREQYRTKFVFWTYLVVNCIFLFFCGLAVLIFCAFITTLMPS